MTDKPIDELWGQGSINLGEWVKAEKYDRVCQRLKEAGEKLNKWLYLEKKGLLSQGKVLARETKAFLSQPEVIKAMKEE